MRFKLAAGFAILAAFFLSAQAAEFNVNPVRIYLDGRAKSGSVVVENNSDQVLTIQASMNSWSQENGPEDLIVPTEDLIVSPPIFKVQPKSRQVVRVGNLKQPDATREGAYRLFLQEVPPPRKPGETGIAIAVRMSLPVFIAPAGNKPAPLVKFKTEAADAKAIRLTLVNSGNAHIQITAISARLPDWSTLAAIPSMMVYLLPGQSHTFTLKTEKAWQNEALRVMIKSDMVAPGVETEVKPE